MEIKDVFKILERALTHTLQGRFCDEDREAMLDTPLSAVAPFDFKIESGISKATIIIEDAPFVIKIPFCGYVNEGGYQDAHSDWSWNREAYVRSKSSAETSIEEKERFYKEYDRDNPEPVFDAEDWFYEFDCANDYLRISGGGWDYCATESFFYSVAEDRGLGAYFAEERLLGKINDTPIYYQTKCIPLSIVRKKEKTARPEVTDLLDQLCLYINPQWVSDFISLYGKKEFLRLNDFLEEYYIGDLRDCNIGYLDGAPILFDYSGFND